MCGEEPPVAIGENVERRARPRIDLEKVKVLLLDEEIDAVQADELARPPRSPRPPPRSSRQARPRSRPGARRRRSETACRCSRAVHCSLRPRHARRAAVAEQQRRHRLAFDPALVIIARFRALAERRRNMEPAAAASPLDEPMRRIVRRLEADFGMRNRQPPAKLGEPCRILDLRDDVGRIAVKIEMPGELADQLRPVFEAAAIDETDRTVPGRELKQLRDEISGVEAAFGRCDRAIGRQRAHAYRDRRRNRRRADDSPPAAPPRRAPGPKGRRSEWQADQTSSRASLKASRKSRHKASSEMAIFLKSPDSVLYLMSPMASAPMPRLPPGNSLP